MADLKALMWRDAIAEARAGAPDRLADLLGSEAPPTSVRQELHAWAYAPTPRQRNAPILGYDVVDRVRELFLVLTSGRYGYGLTAVEARGKLADSFQVSRGTIRNVVEGRGAYKPLPLLRERRSRSKRAGK